MTWKIGDLVARTHVIVQVAEERDIGSENSRSGTVRLWTVQINTDVLYSPVVLVVLQKFVSEEELQFTSQMTSHNTDSRKYSLLS